MVATVHIWPLSTWNVASFNGDGKWVQNTQQISMTVPEKGMLNISLKFWYWIISNGNVLYIELNKNIKTI